MGLVEMEVSTLEPGSPPFRGLPRLGRPPLRGLPRSGVASSTLALMSLAAPFTSGPCVTHHHVGHVPLTGNVFDNTVVNTNKNKRGGHGMTCNVCEDHKSTTRKASTLQPRVSGGNTRACARARVHTPHLHPHSCFIPC